MSVKVLLDTNIIIHRETPSFWVDSNIGNLFWWIDKFWYEKWIHPLTIKEIEWHKDEKIVELMKNKLNSYNVLKVCSPDTDEIMRIKWNDYDDNSRNDTDILKEVYNWRVDFLITQDGGIHEKAKILWISDKVYTINSFLDRLVWEYPELNEYKVLSVKKTIIWKLNLEDHFFDTLRSDYPEFNDWFKRKSQKEAYVYYWKDFDIQWFLYLKPENEKEVYFDINPIFSPKKRLKIWTFKVSYPWQRLWERFLKIVFDNAIKRNVDEIYVTIHNNDVEKLRLINLLQDYWFYYWWTKGKKESVFVRNFSKNYNKDDPSKTFPFVSRESNAFILPIKKVFHTDLLPDSILNNESSLDYFESKPHRNSIKKCYISRSFVCKNIKRWDILLFCMTDFPTLYKSVISTIATVDDVITWVESEEKFLDCCRNRSLFTDGQLKAFWNEKPSMWPEYNPRKHAYIINFLYNIALPTPKINIKRLMELGILRWPLNWKIIQIDREQLNIFIKESKVNESYIVD